MSVEQFDGDRIYRARATRGCEVTGTKSTRA